MTPANFFTAADFESTGHFKFLRGADEVIHLRDAAIIANRILAERSIRVWGELSQSAFEYKFARHKTSTDTHTALLICLEPLRKDSAESLLRELVEHRLIIGAVQLERARKLLEDK